MKASIASALPPQFPLSEVGRMWRQARAGEAPVRVGIFEFTVGNYTTAVTEGEDGIKLKLLLGELGRDPEDDEVLRHAARVRYELRTAPGTLVEDEPLDLDDFELETPVIKHDGDTIDNEGDQTRVRLAVVDDDEGRLTTDVWLIAGADTVEFQASSAMDDGVAVHVKLTADNALALARALAYYVRSTRIITGWTEAVDAALDDILGTEEPVQDVLPDADEQTAEDEQP